MNSERETTESSRLESSGSETDAYYYRARYYDSTTGRFLSEDPIGFQGRNADLYGYVRNRPVRLIDPLGLIAIDPTFNGDCLAALKRALDIIRRIPKNCNCTFKSVGDHRSLDQLMDDPGIAVHFDPKPEDSTELGRTQTGDKTQVWIDAQACRLGRWALAATLVHELAHISFTPGDHQDDRNGPASSSAYGVERACGFLPTVPTMPVNVSAPPNVPISTQDSPLPDHLTPP